MNIPLLLSSLWLPILLSAVVVFIISSLIHMVIKWHASDYNGFANEDAVRAAIRAGNPAPGHYVVPHCKDMKDMGSEAMRQKYREGPVGHFTLGRSGVPALGKFLAMWFVWAVIVATGAACMAVRLYGLDPTRAQGAAKLVGTITFVAYGCGTVTESIWAMRPWSSSAKNLIDAALYGLGSGLVFLWLWP
jgi:hypothetical protein